MKKKTKLGLFGVLGATSTALLYSTVFFYKQAVEKTKQPLNYDYDPIAVVANDPWEKEKLWYQTTPRKILLTQSADALNLSGLLIEQPTPTKKVAILAHGYSGNNREMAPFASLFHELGFHILLPDARGHGESDGNYIGFGWPERKDYLIWIRKMIERFGTDCEIVLYGISMGGATVLNVSGEGLPDNVKAVVEDCGYSSVAKELAYQIKAMYKLPAYPFIPLTSLLTKLKVGYSFEEAAPEEQVKKSTTPTLFIHGDSDHFVPTQMAYELFHAMPGPKELYIVPGAKHAYSYVTNKAEYRFRVQRFLDNYLTSTISF